VRRSPFQTADLVSDILKRVRACGGISRVELARDLGLAPSTAGVYVERLLREGFLVEAEETTGDAGRPPRIIRTNPDGGEFIGIDFEARNVMAVAVDFADRPLRNAHKQIDPDDTAEQVIGKIQDAIEEVLPSNRSRVLAIGVGVPGIVDSENGVALYYKHIPKWENVPLAAVLSGKYGRPVFLENNARSMALAELWFGQGKGHNDFLCVGIRNGVGVGLIVDGHLYCGAHHTAGELGRWRCPPPSGPAAEWFRPGAVDEGPELEELASVRALLRALQRAIDGGRKSVLASCRAPLSVTDVVRACQQRDALAVEVTAEAASALGWAIGLLSLAVDPSKIVLSGPLTLLGEMFLDPLRARVESIVVPIGTRTPEIVHSSMGEFSGALGAAALALHEWNPVGVGAAAADTPAAKPAPARKARRKKK
jgi:N-acetylglucosamine repressor